MCLAIPGKVISVHEPDSPTEEPMGRTGRVSFGGIVKEVNLSCVPEAGIGDYVIVHVGLAISRLDEVEAQQTLEYLRMIGEIAGMEGAAATEGAGGT